MIEEIYRAFLSCDQNITSDTRKISPNCIFFALKGPNFNGNNFVSEALNKGASYAVIDDESAEIKHKTFLVKDVLTTLQELANYHRKQFNISIIGVLKKYRRHSIVVILILFPMVKVPPSTRIKPR